MRKFIKITGAVVGAIVLARKLLHWSPLYRGVALDTMVKLATGEITEEEANRIMEHAITKEV